MPLSPSKPAADREAFISRWADGDGGQERANYALFLAELCDVLEVPRPDQASYDATANAYAFERAVTFREPDGSTARGRIDLYRRGSFVLEAKQSRRPGGSKAVPEQGDLLLTEEPAPAQRGKVNASRAWDTLMMNARRQAEDYAKALPLSEGWPPFLIVCDVGHCFEIYADFSGQGKNYAQFPDRQGFRIYLEDLHSDDIRERLRLIWLDPHKLDPTKIAAKATRDIAERLAKISKHLEEVKGKDGKKLYDPEAVALFLMRCLFTMFAEDVELLPKSSFRDVLKKCVGNPSLFPPLVGQLWEAMDTGGFSFALERDVKKFNGYLFKNRAVFPLPREEIGELFEAAKADWKQVEPAIFGTLLEQALNPAERRKLGAHYTPRAYVERLVVATVLEPLKAEWANVQATAENKRSGGDLKGAQAEIRAFHERLCETTILDPACGTGNFLYVSLELMKRLEGEVLEALASLSEQARFAGYELKTIDPHQFLGLEVNPRAAAIAELVLWIGFLQWHFRTRGGVPPEPILQDFKTIQVKDAVLAWSARELARDERGRPLERTDAEGNRVEVYSYKNPKRPEWPAADYIVGNPPFISNREMRQLLGDGYVDALKAVYPEFNQAADFVLFFWIKALESKATRKVGLVSTARLRMAQNNAVFKSILKGWKIIYAIPDHSWPTDADAAIRVCLIVVSTANERPVIIYAPDHDTVSGKPQRWREYKYESVDFINPNLTCGTDYSIIPALEANLGLSHAGVKPYARSLHIVRSIRDILFENEADADKYCPIIFNGNDLGQKWRGLFVLDLNTFTEDALRTQFPKVYQYILEHTKVERMGERNKRLRDEFWKFEATREDMRNAMKNCARYIATLENSPQRYFVFLDKKIMPDQKLRVIVDDDAFVLGVMSSKYHALFSSAVGGRAGKANTPVYNTRCFSAYPFPVPEESKKDSIRATAEALDAHRKRVLADHPNLKLTGIYNVLEKLRAGVSPGKLKQSERCIFEEGLVLIVRELHDRLDSLVAQAHGWPDTLSDEEILARLVKLNAERVAEEKRGLIRWLRPDYQRPRTGAVDAQAAAEEGAQLAAPLATEAKAQKPLFPTNDLERTATVFTALLQADKPLDAETLARTFRQGAKAQAPIARVLASLARLGHIHSNDGKTFALRRAA